jgi:hypothetical protein
MATAVKKRAAAGRTYTPEERRVRAAVETHLPSVKDVVRSYDVEFRENYAGEPAVYVTLRIPRPNTSDSRRVKRLLHFWQKVRQDILEQDSKYFPYVELRGASKTLDVTS